MKKYGKVYEFLHTYEVTIMAKTRDSDASPVAERRIKAASLVAVMEHAQVKQFLAELPQDYIPVAILIAEVGK